MNGLHDVLLKLRSAAAEAEATSEYKDGRSRANAAKRFADLAPLLFAPSKRQRLAIVSPLSDANHGVISESTTDVALYQNMMDQCNEQDLYYKEEAATSLEFVKELRRVYLFGLQKVSNLQDLREAPDAIMPGNFVGQGL